MSSLLPFSHIHTRATATDQQLLKRAFGASTKSFPGHPHSFACSGSRCLSCVNICGAHTWKTQPALPRWPALRLTSKIFSANILLHQLLYKRVCRPFWYVLQANMFAFFVHSTFHTFAAAQSPQQFSTRVSWLNVWELLSFWIMLASLVWKTAFSGQVRQFETPVVNVLMEERKFGSASSHGWDSTTSSE